MKLITAQQSRDARRELGLSQTEVAKALDLNRQYLSEFETGFSTRLTAPNSKNFDLSTKKKSLKPMPAVRISKSLSARTPLNL